MSRREQYDYGEPYAELGAYVHETSEEWGARSRLSRPLRRHRGRRRGRWVDRRPTKKPRWLRDPPDPDTVVRWAKNARDQAERARTFARDYRAALERKEKGRPPSIVLLRARSLSDRDLRSRVAKKGLCAGLCGTHSDSKYCATCGPIVRLDRARIRAVLFRSAARAS